MSEVKSSPTSLFPHTGHDVLTASQFGRLLGLCSLAETDVLDAKPGLSMRMALLGSSRKT